MGNEKVPAVSNQGQEPVPDPYEPLPGHRSQVEAMAGYGIPDVDLAEVLEVDLETLRLHYRRELEASSTASLLEAGANVLVGYGVALAAQQLVFPLFGIHTTLAQDSVIAAVFTLVSLARSYLLRHQFERIGTGRGGGSKLKPGRTYRLAFRAERCGDTLSKHPFF